MICLENNKKIIKLDIMFKLPKIDVASIDRIDFSEYSNNYIYYYYRLY